MSDNWSPSFVSLATAGDWATWEFTLDATTAAKMNGNPSVTATIEVRYAVTVAGDINDADFLVMVNDFVVGLFGTTAWSPTTWSSAARFGAIVTGSGGFADFATPANDRQIFAPYAVPGWKTGSNTIRVLNRGGVPIDIDYIALYPDGGPSQGSTPGVIETAPSGFLTHVDGTSLLPKSSSASWYRRGDQVIDSGSYSHTTTIDLDAICPVDPDDYIARVHVHDGAAEATGRIGATNSNTGADITAADLAAGHARIFGNGNTINVAIWYGGDDDFPPAVYELGGWPPTWTGGCGGWAVGRSAVN